MEGMEGVWVIPPKRKNFSNIISTRDTQHQQNMSTQMKPSERELDWDIAKLIDRMREMIARHTEEVETSNPKLRFVSINNL